MITVGDIKTPLSTTGTTRQKIRKDTEKISNPFDQQNLIDIYGIFQQTTVVCTFFSSAHGNICRPCSI